jgi:ribosomal protein S18 acetylase RimI-like enzyme
MSRNKKSRAFKNVQNVQLRPGNADDVPFIFRRMLKDLRRSDFWTGMPNPLFYTYAHRGWEHTIVRSIVKVAYGGPVQTEDGVKTGNPTHILGFIIAEVTSIGLVVHYMNVRRDYDTNGLITADYRRQGIGKKLVESYFKDYGEMKVTYTNRTRMFSFEQEFRNKIDDDPNMEYNPCLWFTLNPPGWETGILATLNPQTQKDFHDMEQKYPATA